MDRGYRPKRQNHPKDVASFFSLATFSYILKFVRNGRKEEIHENNLSHVMKSLNSKKLGDDLERYWEVTKPSIMKALMSCHGPYFIILVVAHLTSNFIETYSIPWALGRFISYFETNQTHTTKQEAFLYALLMMVINISFGLWNQHYSLWRAELALRVQSSISSLLYRKILVLNQAKLNYVTSGNVITKIAKDALEINEAIQFIIHTVSEIIKVVLICYLLYGKVRAASIVSIAIIFSAIFFQGCMGYFMYKRRGACNAKTDQRLRQTHEALSSIQLIKMYRWESFFKEKLLWLRKKELKELQMLFILKGMTRTIGFAAEAISHVSTLIVYLWLGKTLNADIVYYTSNLFRKLMKTLIFIPTGIQSLTDCLMALRRINTIIIAEEKLDFLNTSIKLKIPEISFIEADVQINDLKILQNLNMNLKSGLNILIGPSASGKTSLLKTILEEYDISKGRMRVQGTVSYAPQNPWIFPSSLKQNILFGEPIHDNKFNEILNICGLTYDVNNFALGDEVILIDGGANLSKGQRARISLARALYKESTIYLLDDCLASLDPNSQNHVFHNAIKNYLRDRLCLLVTHSTKFINEADNIVIMEGGTIKYSGKPNGIPPTMIEKKEYYCKEMNNSECQYENEKDIDSESEEESEKMLLPKMKDPRSENIYKEFQQSGRVDSGVYKSYLKYGGGLIMLVAIGGTLILCHVSTGIGDKFLSEWLNMQKTISSERFSTGGKKSIIETRYSSTSEVPIGFCNQTILPANATYQNITTNFSNITGEMFTSVEKPQNEMDYFSFFIGAVLVAVMFNCIEVFVNNHFSIKISRRIHESMIQNMMHAYMKFYDTHLIGTILSRFSRDLYLLDEFIPGLWRKFRNIVMFSTSCILIATVNPVFAALFVFMAVVFYFMAEYFLSTTRNLQRLSCSSLSPMIGHINTTLEGLIVIRAHRTQQILRDEFDKHQDLFVTARHLKEISMRILTFYFHLISSLFISFLTISLLFMKDALAGDTGLILIHASLLGVYLELVPMSWVFLENSMTSVERILEYTKQPQENDTGLVLPNWPSQGAIKFQNVSLAYREDGKKVLKNLNFTIRSKEKIGIVGKNGAGKSSLISILFKISDFSGNILIDNVNIKKISSKHLRRCLKIVPQDFFIFAGTVRTNIDPFEILSDETIWNILDIVNLKSHFKNLDEVIDERKLSIGQKQLISVARVLTEETKILILDEATANMDETIELIVQTKIQELFRNCTVITVTHRLNTVVNCDRILVLDKGEIIEFDTPKDLLRDTNGKFYRMIQQEHS